MNSPSTRPLAVVTGTSSGIGYELAKQFAQQGFEALMAGKDQVVAGSLKTKLQGAANEILPETAKAAAHRSLAEPGSGEK